MNRCEKCGAKVSSDNWRQPRLRRYTVPAHEVWGDAMPGEKVVLCDWCATEANLRD